MVGGDCEECGACLQLSAIARALDWCGCGWQGWATSVGTAVRRSQQDPLTPETYLPMHRDSVHNVPGPQMPGGLRDAGR